MDHSVIYNIIEDFDLEQIPTIWKNIDFKNFSEDKMLYPYQREALENALKILFIYYQGGRNKDNDARKKDFLKLTEFNGLNKELQDEHFAYTNQESKAYEILVEYFEEEGNKIPCFHFINRISFWMATGSGKSIVLIKLIELLQDLMRSELIPKNEIIFLTHRLDLIEQLKKHMAEFNQYSKKERGLEFIFRDLKEFPEQKMQGNLFKDTSTNIYVYRSDLISDVQKENIIDFKNYENNGEWFVILDEAHKGDSEEVNVNSTIIFLAEMATCLIFQLRLLMKLIFLPPFII
jgi:type I site-specific restriction endonuclease